jgi:hypothetical protein
VKEEHDMGHTSALRLEITVLKLTLLEFGTSCVERAKFQKIVRNINI